MMAQQYATDEAGNVWEVDAAGNAVRFVSAAAGAPASVAPNQLKVQAAQQDLSNDRIQGARTAQQMALEAARLPVAAQVAAADASKATTEAEAARIALEKSRREIAAPDQNKTRRENLQRAIDGMRKAFAAGPLATQGIEGLKDFLPLTQNKLANDSGNAAAALIGPALNLSASQLNTPGEVERAVGPYIPQSSDTDAQIRAKIERLQGMANAMGASSPSPADQRRNDDPRAATIGNAGPPSGGNPRGPAGYDVAGVAGGVGGPSGGGGGFSNAAGLAMAQKLSKAYTAGAGVSQLNELLRNNGYQEFTDPQSIAQINKRGPLNFAPPQVDDSRSGAGRFIGDNLNNGVGAYAVGAADALTAGNLDSLAGGQTRLAQDYLEKNNPTASLLGTVTGGALAAGGAELGLARAGLSAGRAALAGDALYGGAYGAGSADGGNRLLGALAGATGGAVGGLAGRSAVSGVAGLARGRFGLPQEQAVTRGENLAIDALRSDNMSPRTALSALREAQAVGVPSIPADLGDNARGMFSSLARQPGPERSTLRGSVIDRQMGQGERIRSAITEDLGPIANVRQQSDALIQQGRDAAAPFYNRAYETPVPSTPELDAVLNTPFGRQAIGRARTIAANERRNPSELNFALDAEGNPVMNPFPGRQVADDLAARAELDAAQEAYRAARNGPGDVDAARTRIANAREALRMSQQNLRGAPDPNQAASVPTYTTQTLDYAKRGMDDILEEQRNQITGRLVLDEAGRAQNGVRSELLREVDRLNPSYGQARAAYAGPAAERDALALGRDALRMSPEDVQVAAGRLTPSQRSQFGLGYRTELSSQIDNRVDGADKVGALIGTPRKRAALAAAMGETQGLTRFNQRLSAEQAANETYRAVATGSATAGRLADDAVMGSDQALLERAVDAGQRFRSGGVVGGGISLALDALKSAGTYGFGKKAAAARSDAAGVLLDPARFEEVAQRLGRNAAVRRINDRAIARAIERPRAYAGLFGAPLLPALIPYGE